MKLKLPLLILWTLAALTVVSQSEKCYQTVVAPCGDSIVEYLTAKEKRNLYKLQIALEKQKATIEYLESNGRADSWHIAELNATIDGLQTQVVAALEAKVFSDIAYNKMVQACNGLKRQMRNQKVKAWAAGVLGSFAAFGTGAGVAFLIIKTR